MGAEDFSFPCCRPSPAATSSIANGDGSHRERAAMAAGPCMLHNPSYMAMNPRGPAVSRSYAP